MSDYDPRQVITIRYTNYRGVTADRRIVPITVRFASTEWHPGEQWILDALDVEKGVIRSFALRDVHALNCGSNDGDANAPRVEEAPQVPDSLLATLGLPCALYPADGHGGVYLAPEEAREILNDHDTRGRFVLDIPDVYERLRTRLGTPKALPRCPDCDALIHKLAAGVGALSVDGGKTIVCMPCWDQRCRLGFHVPTKPTMYKPPYGPDAGAAVGGA